RFVSLWNPSPDKHSPLAVRNIPADTPQPAAQCPIARRILFSLLLDKIIRTGQGCDRRQLYRIKDPIINLRAEQTESADDITVSDHKGDSCPGQIIGLGE